MGFSWRTSDRAVQPPAELAEAQADVQALTAIKVTLEAAFAEGVGLSGRAWKSRDLVFVPNIADVSDCVRAPAASRAGVRSGVCFPLIDEDRVVGTMDFFTTEVLQPSAGRLAVLRAVGNLVSRALAHLQEAIRQEKAAQDVDAVSHVIRELTQATSREQALRSALETIRRYFDWQYGSFWQLDQDQQVLRFSIESGDAGAEFREVTRQASFAKGVGLSGRTWARGDLYFVEDLGEMTDCVRRPAAQAAGVKSGVCLPVRVGGEIVGTIQARVDEVTASLAEIHTAVEEINQTQGLIRGVLTEQVAVTRAILD